MATHRAPEGAYKSKLILQLKLLHGDHGKQCLLDLQLTPKNEFVFEFALRICVCNRTSYLCL